MRTTEKFLQKRKELHFPIILSLSSMYVLTWALDVNFKFCGYCYCNPGIFFTRVQDIFEDLAADRKIRSYTIKCPRRSRGCQWTDELRTKDVSLIYRRLKIPKRNFSTVSFIIRSIRKSPTNYANSYSSPTRNICTIFKSRDQWPGWCGESGKREKSSVSWGISYPPTWPPLFCFLVLK